MIAQSHPMQAAPAAAAPPGPPVDEVDVNTIARVLKELSIEIEALGYLLCSDMTFAMQHMEQLQAIDLISQKQRSLATLLEADCPKAALSGIGLDALVHRLRGE